MYSLNSICLTNWSIYKLCDQATKNLHFYWILIFWSHFFLLDQTINALYSLNSICSKNLSIYQICDQATKNLHFYWNSKLSIIFLPSWWKYQWIINLYSFIQAIYYWDHIIALATMSLLPFQFACPFFNLRYYNLGILLCNETYPNLIKLISSLILRKSRVTSPCCA
jgi:hypothetical protein